jgi:hypothetical protein
MAQTQRDDALDVLGIEYAELIDEVEAAIVKAINGDEAGRLMLLKSAPPGSAAWWLRLARGFE